MKRFNSSVIGVFVIGALALAVVGLITFGGQGWWRDRSEFVIYFKESVHGLERGSSIKFKGVRAGRVAEINVTYHPETGTAIAQVVCEVDRSTVVDPQGRELDIRQDETLRRLVEEGLQARLNLIGITGMLFIELDFFGETRKESFALGHPELQVVPSLPSALSGVTDHVAEVARQLESMDFEGLGAAATRFLNTASTTLEEANLEELIGSLHETVEGLNELLRSEELRSAVTSAGQSFEDMSRLARRMEAQVDPLAENLGATSEELRATLEEVAETFSALHDIVGPRLGLGPHLAETLDNLNEAARSVQRLADFLERNPQALLRGRGEAR